MERQAGGSVPTDGVVAVLYSGKMSEEPGRRLAIPPPSHHLTYPNPTRVRKTFCAAPDPHQKLEPNICGLKVFE